MIELIKTVWQRIRNPSAGTLPVSAAMLDRWAMGSDHILPEERQLYDDYMALSNEQIKAQIAARFARRDFTIAERESFKKASQ